jgi:hypothetical protein
MDAFAVEYIAVHDRPPIEVPHGKGCACWAEIARQFARSLAYSETEQRFRGINRKILAKLQ